MTDGTYSLRQATELDTEFLEDMLVAAAEWNPSRPALGRERTLADPHLARYIEGWPRPGDIGTVAVDAEHTCIGAAWLRFFDADCPGYGFVSPDVPELAMGVLEPWRARGIGRAMLADVVRRASERGIGRISLSVERANPAQRLYESAGFTAVASGPQSDTMVSKLRSDSLWPEHLDVGAVRFARPTAKYDEVLKFYRDIVGLPVIAQWRDHSGYDGVVFGLPGRSVHMELLQFGDAPRIPEPHPENQLVLYLSGPDALAKARDRFTDHGQVPVAAANPYWTAHGAVLYEDPDGWLVVLVPRAFT